VATVFVAQTDFVCGISEPLSADLLVPRLRDPADEPDLSTLPAHQLTESDGVRWRGLDSLEAMARHIFAGQSHI
jgi:hypothetical protein